MLLVLAGVEANKIGWLEKNCRPWWHGAHKRIHKLAASFLDFHGQDGGRLLTSHDCPVSGVAMSNLNILIGHPLWNPEALPLEIPANLGPSCRYTDIFTMTTAPSLAFIRKENLQFVNVNSGITANTSQVPWEWKELSESDIKLLLKSGGVYKVRYMLHDNIIESQISIDRDDVIQWHTSPPQSPEQAIIIAIRLRF